MTLTEEQISSAAQKMMAAAQAHRWSSRVVLDDPEAKPPSIGAMFAPLVSFELILLSVEQSLRLLLLLHFSHVELGTNHNLDVLYRRLSQKSDGSTELKDRILAKMNELGGSQEVLTINDREVKVCLKKHDSSYTSLRYFGLDRHGRSTSDWEIAGRDVQILQCMALALVDLNMDEMVRRSIPAPTSMRRVPQSDMTEELKALHDRMVSGTRREPETSV